VHIERVGRLLTAEDEDKVDRTEERWREGDNRKKAGRKRRGSCSAHLWLFPGLAQSPGANG